MATGYTSAIEKGISFKQFVLNCSRAFGALITMRDDPKDAPIPDELKPTDYHLKALAKAQAELAHLESLSFKGAAKKAEADFIKALAEYDADRDKDRELERKYDAMLRQVWAWTPPTPDHQGLKDFMVSQITESIRWDCGYNRERPTLKTPQEWLTKSKESALWSINYHTRENEKEVERCEGRTKWIRDLKKSLEGDSSEQ